MQGNQPQASSGKAPVRYRPWNQGSRRALAMLRLFPLSETSVPRVHIEPASSAIGLRVFDRPTGQRLLVYTPRFGSQFQNGHRAGRWYVRPVGDVGTTPLGPGFATAKAAVDAITAGRWSFQAIVSERRELPLRVIWEA